MKWSLLTKLGYVLMFIGSSSAFSKEFTGPLCHLHAPGSEITEDISQLPKFSSINACDTENRQRYSAMGRCHCTFSRFSNRRFPVFNRDHGELKGNRGDAPLQ